MPVQPRPRLVPVPDEPRLAIAAVVEGPAGPFTVVTTHLSFVPGYNVRQLRALTRWVARMPGPVFLLGDLNLPGALPASGHRVASARPSADVPRRRTSGAVRPRARARVGRRRRSAQALSLAVSDHCALVVDIGADLTRCASQLS